MKFHFKGNIPSSKNSKQWTGRCLISSKTVQKYLKINSNQWEDKSIVETFRSILEGKQKPYRIGFYFIRDTKRKFDYINALQLPCDLMVKNGWIDDDNCDEIIPIIQGYHVDKLDPGLIIEVL
ncbi:MAG: hypothetical protein ACRCU6_12485 [Fusobacteriaceae bacterium]